MIIYRCVCCFKKYFSTEVLICSVCNGDEFLKENLNLAHPESVIPPLPQPTNSSRKSTNPTGEVKIPEIGNSPCQREKVSSVGEDFIFPYEDSAINEFYRNDDVEASNFRSQNILLEQEQLLKNCSKNNTAMNTFLPGIQNSWCQTQTSHVHNKETETPLNFNYIVYPFSASSSKPQHLMDFYHQSSKQERENQSSMKRMLEKQITVESSQIDSQDSPIDLTGSSLIAPESCTSHYVTENVINKKKFRDTNQKGSNSSDLLNKRGNSPNENFLPEDLERENEVSKQNACTSHQQTRIEGGENYRRKRLPTSKKGFRCWKCRKGFANESELNIHRKNVCEPNLYKCGKCSEEFSHDWKLKEHLVVHREVKPFECEHCDLAFNKERYLTSHMKKYHESEMETYFFKPESKNDFKCGKCSRKFTNESELYDHLQQNSCDPNPCK
ncbi:hypothetical protein AVEN_80850-1 [Araneus ventricosus]|uniref:C2H2-type domain-containing protein n=1 Tax=Araneus ventricosus TaxID=182803 RepID=A0A4Y2Q4G6_ARAVE|nr:hypothetical protein AVEN_80850-1 [Araneus ventricosus]